MRRFIALTSIAAVLAAAAGPRAGAQAGTDPFQLKTAGPNSYALLAIGGQPNTGGSPTSINMSNPTGGVFGTNSPAAGDVGVTAGGKIDQADTTITGKIYLGTGATQQMSGSGSNGGIVTGADAQLNQAAADAVAASAYAAGLTPTIGVTSITGSQTIMGTTGLNVLDLSNVTLNGATVTLTAPIGGYFVLNDTGNFDLNGSSFVFEQPNAGGTLVPSGNADSVLYNITGTGDVHFTGGGNASQVTGILLAPKTSVALSPGLVTGEIISGGSQIQIVSGAQIHNPVPELSTGMLAALSLLFLGGMLLRARKGSTAMQAA